jgi:hypothetical protein
VDRSVSFGFAFGHGGADGAGDGGVVVADEVGPDLAALIQFSEAPSERVDLGDLVEVAAARARRRRR